MEGIAGTFGYSDKTLIKTMLSKLKHRGPDSSETFIDDTQALGAVRLERVKKKPTPAIVVKDGLAVASDSYIFNREFVRMSIAPGIPEDVSDAELFLAMYKTIGTRMFNYIDGAFAVAILDNGKTVLARDGYGLKPLYISMDGDRGVYSSEIKSQELFDKAFTYFPPGRVFVQGTGMRRIALKAVPWAERKVPKAPPDRVKHLVEDSVRRAAGDSKALNVLLSGGIDSSVIAAASASVVPKIASVCVGVEGSEDIEMARLVADQLGLSHKELVYGPEEMLKVLEDAIYYAETFDFPLVRSCIPNFMATHEFAERKNITLCGEGGDEVFAGYDFLFDIRSDEELRTARMALLKDGHTTGFQRVDRMTSSASLDGRMPLMSRSVVDYGLSLGRKALVGSKVEKSKYVLRKAFSKSLPKQVAWRRKRRFSDGAGSMNALVSYAEKEISDKEFEKERRSLPGGRIRTKEELLYYRIFARHFPSSSARSVVGITPRP
jgi:asparagine synthase (glutamine-hydrolysing)